MDWLSLVLPQVPAAHLAQWGIIISLCMPYLIACIQQPHWSAAIRARVAFGLCALVAAGVLASEGLLSTANLLASATALFALSATLYRQFAKHNGADKLENVTSALWDGFLGAGSGNAGRSGPLIVTLPSRQSPDPLADPEPLAPEAPLSPDPQQLQ